MEKFTLLFLAVLTAFSACKRTEDPNNSSDTNVISEDRMLLVLAAPSIYDDYYAPVFNQVVNFQIAYAKGIMGKDNVVVLVDADTRRYYENDLPNDILLTAEVFDIWMRDFTTVNPLNPVQFQYTWASMTEQESQEVQNSFKSFADQYGIERHTTDLKIDGGNIVDNYAGKVITTTRFMTDNNLTLEEAKSQLRNLLGATEVAILPPDEDVLAHADGMVSWIDEDVLLVNDYSSDPSFQEAVLTELQTAFPSTRIIEVPVEYTESTWANFESACGINLNATATLRNIYVPVFSMPHEQAVLDILNQNTGKNVVQIDANGVCEMGGSVRCLTWQLAGSNAEKIIMAARTD